MIGGAVRLFLVEDDEIDIMAFERVINKLNADYTLDVARDAKEALAKISGNNFDCIFLDYQLPGTDGLRLLKELREKGVTSPIAVLTSQGDEKLAVEMMKAGAFDYFPKAEVNSENLIKVIRAAFRIVQSEKERIAAEFALQENERLLDVIYNSTSVAMCLTQADGKLVRVNNAFTSIFGYSKEEVFGLYIQDFLIPGQKYDYIDQFKKLFNKDSDVLNEWVFTHKSGRFVNIEQTSAAFTDQKGESYQIVTLKDNTEQKRFEAELIEAKRQAEIGATAKAEFLSNMSHEIRTPMNAIIGLTNLLLDENFEGKNLENLKSIKYSADNLLFIINDILDFSKIEAGKVSFERIDFSPKEKVAEICKMIKFKAEEKSIGLTYEFDSNVPPLISGDPYRLNQILLNLSGNAIKFTSKGEVKIKVSVVESTEEKFVFRFDVIDSGIGIPESKFDSIFESFSQAYTDTTRKFGGTGLGLAITKKLTELQGGQILLSSTVNVGSTFSVQIPYYTPTGNSEKELKQINSVKDLGQVEILLAEDNQINQIVATQILSKWNGKVTIANNGKEALEFLKSRPFDIVLMDLQMPELSGYEVTQELRKMGSFSPNTNIPIIALSADAFLETKRKVLLAGMTDFVTKPFNQDELYGKIAEYTQK